MLVRDQQVHLRRRWEMYQGSLIPASLLTANKIVYANHNLDIKTSRLCSYLS